MDSDDSIEKRKQRREQEANKDDESSEYVSDVSEDEATRLAREEEELKQHRIEMAKRAGRLEARQNKMRSSKGFLTQQSTVTEEESKAKKPKEEGEICPYKSCGRRFVSEAQLKNHMDRRHKVKIEEPPKNEQKEK